MINNRSNDMLVEREIALFLDEHLYSDKELFTEFVRTDGREEQLSGSDLLLSTVDGKLKRSIIDEKVASRYANKDLDTFALELSFLNKNGQKRCGWLLDSTKKTEYYLFGWILSADIPYMENKKRYDTNLIRNDNIRRLEWMLVKRSDIVKFLEDRGWTIEKLSRQDEKIRQNGKVSTNAFIDDISFRYSGMYIECPINLLMKKETYKKLSILSGIIEV